MQDLCAVKSAIWTVLSFVQCSQYYVLCVTRVPYWLMCVVDLHGGRTTWLPCFRRSSVSSVRPLNVLGTYFCIFVLGGRVGVGLEWKQLIMKYSPSHCCVIYSYYVMLYPSIRGLVFSGLYSSWRVLHIWQQNREHSSPAMKEPAFWNQHIHTFAVCLSNHEIIRLDFCVNNVRWLAVTFGNKLLSQIY